MDVPKQSSCVPVGCSQFFWVILYRASPMWRIQGFGANKGFYLHMQVPPGEVLCWLTAGSCGMPLDVPLCPGEWWHWWQPLVGLVPRIEQHQRGFHGQRERISHCAEPIFIHPKMQGTSSWVCESPAQDVVKIWHVVFNFSTPKFLELNGEGRYHMELRKLWSKYSLKLTRKFRDLVWVLL